MASFPYCNHKSVYGHAIQEKGARGKRRPNGELKLCWRGLLSKGAGRNAAAKHKTSKHRQ